MAEYINREELLANIHEVMRKGTLRNGMTAKMLDKMEARTREYIINMPCLDIEEICPLEEVDTVIYTCPSCGAVKRILDLVGNGAEDVKCLACGAEMTIAD